jgi:hypothetical protein
MYSWVSTEFRRQQNSVDTEFPHGDRIPPWTRNSPVDTEFPRGPGILSTRNSVDTEFGRHGIPSTRNAAYLFYFRIFSMLCYAIYFRSIH